jgi:hypothetical protein
MLAMKSESHAFRGITIGLLLSIPLWLLIAATAWDYYSSRKEAWLRENAEKKETLEPVETTSDSSAPAENSSPRQ